MKKQVYEINENNCLKGIHIAEFDNVGNPIEELPINFITIDPPNGLYRAKWTGTEWIEDMPQAEIDALNEPQPPTAEERLVALELAMLDIVLGGAV